MCVACTFHNMGNTKGLSWHYIPTLDTPLIHQHWQQHAIPPNAMQWNLNLCSEHPSINFYHSSNIEVRIQPDMKNVPLSISLDIIRDEAKTAYICNWKWWGERGEIWRSWQRGWLAKSSSNCHYVYVSEVVTANKCHGAATQFGWLMHISSYLLYAVQLFWLHLLRNIPNGWVDGWWRPLWTFRHLYGKKGRHIWDGIAHQTVVGCRMTPFPQYIWNSLQRWCSSVAHIERLCYGIVR